MEIGNNILQQKFWFGLYKFNEEIESASSYHNQNLGWTSLSKRMCVWMCMWLWCDANDLDSHTKFFHAWSTTHSLAYNASNTYTTHRSNKSPRITFKYIYYVYIRPNQNTCLLQNGRDILQTRTLLPALLRINTVQFANSGTLGGVP